MIIELNNFLAQEQIDTLLAVKANSQDVKPGSEESGNLNKDRVTSTIYGEEREIVEILKPNTFKISNEVTLGAYNYIGTHIAEYKEGTYYGWHVDNPTYQSGHAPNDYRTTKLSFTLFLNEDYEGGNLEIETEDGTKCIKMSTGDAVFYPTDYLHRVTPVTKGTRIVVVGWLDCLYKNPRDRFLIKQFGIVNSELQQLYNLLEKEDYENIDLEKFHKIINIILMFRSDLLKRSLNR